MFFITPMKINSEFGANENLSRITKLTVNAYAATKGLDHKTNSSF